MRKTVGSVFATLSVLIGSSFGINVSVSAPANNSTVASPVTITASGSSTHPITGWHIYVDGNTAYSGGAVQSIAAPVPLALGSHQLVVRAWDSTGAYASENLTLTAASAAVTAAASAAVTVTLTTPINGALVTSPVGFSASAASGYPVTGWVIYADSTAVYTSGAASSISPSLALATGSHQIIVRAWNSTGAYGSANLGVTVGTASPTPPSNALVFSKLEDTGGWMSCSSPTCSGGIAAAATYWMAPNQTTPALDGSSAEFYIDGPQYATDLFGLTFTHNAAVSHFIHDFYVYVDQASVSAIEALEFDLFHVANGNKYMFGTECNYWKSTWDVWNEASQQWISTNAACSQFAPNSWHHVQWAVEQVGNQIHYLTVTVDGSTQTIGAAYAYQPAPPSSWQNGSLGVQIQQDLSYTPGSGAHEWVDKETVYAW
jgi:hypothetical protein